MSIDKMPWDAHPHIWKKSTFMSWLRGGIRRSLWNKSPIKIGFIKKNRMKIKNPRNTKRSPKEVWGAKCELCCGLFTMRNIEVDHKAGNHKLTEIEDIQSYIENIVMIEEKDLQMVCKKCHKIKSHAEKKGISFEEARTEKKLIAYTKLSAAKQSNILMLHNSDCNDALPYNNAKNRKASLLSIIDKLSDLD
jgi:hypothetical protein